MRERMKPILGALVVGYVVNLAGIIYFFGPIATNDMPAGPIAPGWLSLLIAAVLLVLLLDWVVQAVGSPVRSAMIIAVSQILLVDVYYVLLGDRGVATGIASGVQLLITWAIIGAVYGKLSPAPGFTQRAHW